MESTIYTNCKVEVSALEYEELIRKAERIETVKRYIEANEYISVKDLIAILDIKELDNEKGNK